MKIKYLNFNTTTFKNISQVETQNQHGNQNLSKIAKVAGCVGLAYIGIGLASKNNFNKNILKKGLEKGDELLINKKTGEAFTGKIKSNVGTIIGFNKIETCVFKNGIITEKTYKDIFGRELQGYFYKNNEICVNAHIYKSFRKDKRFAIAWKRKNGSTCHLDGITKDSIFDIARKLLNNEK
ncbi:hypothetical protein J6R97_02295 [bacterium]|nr:hypothetical protein [bacterium]